MARPRQKLHNDATAEIKEHELSLDIVCYCKCCAPYLHSLILKYKAVSFNPSSPSSLLPLPFSYWKVRNTR